MAIFVCILSAAWLSFSMPAHAWTIFERGERRPLILHGAGDVSSGDMPDRVRAAMQVDAVGRTVEWRGDRGWIRAAAGERLAMKNGRRVVLPRPVRFLESAVVFPEEFLKQFPDIFSFVEVAEAEDGEVLKVGEPVAEPEPGLREVPPSEPIPPPQPSPTGGEGEGRPVRTVVIDPGHGGSDPGAKGKAGAVEKDIVLAIGLEVARELRARESGLKVILTRSRDEFVTLYDRAKIANVNKGDVFVSIHANSVKRNTDASGFEVYHLDLEGANDDARAVAAFENAEPATGAGQPAAGRGADLTKILGDVMQLQYLDASLELSKHIADRMAAGLEGATKFRGSKGAFFYVLKDVMAPAVLVEVGFVTNEWEASFLQKGWYQRKIAEGILDGILDFKRAEESRFSAPVPAADSPSPAAPPGEP